MSRFFESSPIIIGGVGGSGTRLVAEMLKTVGIFMGNNLNIVNNDNRGLDEVFPVAHETLREARGKGGKPVVIGSDYPIEFEGDVAGFIDRGLEGFEKDMDAGYCAQSAMRAVWGWKLPGVYNFLQPLSKYFGGFKYIRVVRHGVDMAFSSNQHPLKI